MSDDVSSDEGDGRLEGLCYAEKWAEAEALLKSSSAAKRKELARYRDKYGSGLCPVAHGWLILLP